MVVLYMYAWGTDVKGFGIEKRREVIFFNQPYCKKHTMEVYWTMTYNCLSYLAN